MVSSFEQGVAPGPFCDSLIKNSAETFSEIRRRTVADINVEEAVVAMNNGSHSRMAKPKEANKASQPLRINETSVGKKAKVRNAPYKKGEFKARGKEKDFHPKFLISYKELINILTVAEKLRFP